MNRKQRRDYAKQVARGEIGIVEQPKTKLIVSELVDYKGRRYTDINKYLEVMEKATADQCARISWDILHDTEIYICVANILTMLLAIEKAIGNLKTVQNSYQKILDCYNECSDYVDYHGIRETYEELKRDYGISLNFDDCDLKVIQNAEEEVHKRFKIYIGRESA